MIRLIIDELQLSRLKAHYPEVVLSAPLCAPLSLTPKAEARLSPEGISQQVVSAPEANHLAPSAVCFLDNPTNEVKAMLSATSIVLNARLIDSEPGPSVAEH
jgi:hypothetical protein